MARIFLVFLISFFGFLMGCSDHSASTVARQPEQPAWNISGPDFSSISVASGPALSGTTEVDLGGTVVSNVVVDADFKIYVISKVSQANNVQFKLNRIDGLEASPVRESVTFTLDEPQTYFNLTIDSSYSVYFNANDSLHVAPNAFSGSADTQIIDLEIPSRDEHVSLIDGRGNLIVLKKETETHSKLAVYKLFDLETAVLESVFESTETFQTNVMPIIVNDKLFIHTITALTQYDLLNLNVIVPVDNPVTIATGTVPVRVLYLADLDILAYEYVDADGVRTGLRLFSSSAEGSFLSFLSYNDTNDIKMLMGVNSDNTFKFLTSSAPIRVSIEDYQLISAQLSLVNANGVLLCGDDINTFHYGNTICTDTLALGRLQSAFFAGDDSAVIAVLDTDTIRLRKLNSTNSALQTSTDTVSIDISTEAYLDELFPPLADGNQFTGYYTFDQPTLINSTIIYRNGNSIYIVR